MGKKAEKKLCWNCDGYVGQHLQACPYCGNDLTKNEVPSLQRKTPFGQSEKNKNEKEAIPKPLYAQEMLSQDIPPSNQGWRKGVDESKESEVAAAETPSNKNELLALLLLLPGVVLLLFGLVLIFFSKNGVLSVQWNEQFAYFYFLGAIPLLILGWRFLK